MALVLAVLVCLRGQAQEVVLNADFVWGQHCARDAQNPVIVTIDNPGRTIEGMLVARWGTDETYLLGKSVTPETLQGAYGVFVEQAVTIPEKSRRRSILTVDAPVSHGGQSLWIFLISGGRVVRAKSVPGLQFKGKGPVIGQVGGSPIRGLLAAKAEVGYARADELPDRWHGYSLLHALLWLDADAATIRDPATMDALRQWLAGGGRLTIARASTQGLVGTFLEELAGLKVRGVSNNSDWRDVAAIAGRPSSPEGTAAVIVCQPRTATVLARAGDVPLVLRARHGRGFVTFVAFDPLAPSFAAWEGSDAFWRQLLEMPVVREDGEEERHAVHPLDKIIGSAQATQLLGEHPQIPLPSLGWAFLMIAIYVILVGPVDFLVLRHLRRMELTWITFPVYVGVFSAIALLAGTTATRYPPVARETVVVDYIPDAKVTRGWSLTSILTPRERTLTVVSRKPSPLLIPRFTLSYGDQTSDARVREGRIQDWYFQQGATGIVVSNWCESGVSASAELAAARSVIVVNDTGAVIRSAVFLTATDAYSLGDIPLGRVEIQLQNRLGDAWSGLTQLGATEPPQNTDDDWNNGRRYGGLGRGSDLSEDHIRGKLRGLVAGLCLSRVSGRQLRARPTGVAREMDAASWVETGGALVLGWTTTPGTIDVQGLTAQQSTETFVRIFVRHD